MKKIVSLLILLCLLSVTESCRKKKPVNPVNNKVNITFKSNPVNSGPCNISPSFFNKMKIIKHIGILNASNQIEWLPEKEEVYTGNQALNCCAYPFSVPKDGSYVVKFTVFHIDCLPCCRNNCSGNNGKPMYSKEIIMPAWQDNQNVEVQLDFTTCMCC